MKEGEREGFERDILFTFCCMRNESDDGKKWVSKMNEKFERKWLGMLGHKKNDGIRIATSPAN
jgi:hypothetical protein